MVQKKVFLKELVIMIKKKNLHKIKIKLVLLNENVAFCILILPTNYRDVKYTTSTSLPVDRASR